MAGPPVGPLLKTVFNSILRVFFVCLAGYVLAWRGILDTDTRRKLNRVNTSLLAPSLLFSKVAFSLSPDKLRELWIIPIIFTTTTMVSMLIACLFATILRLKKSQRAFSVAASMFMNSNSLPVALMQSLVATVPDLKWEDDDNEDTMIGRALTYLVMYLTLGMMLRWSYGVHLLSQGDPESASTKVLRGAEGAEETRLLVGSEEIPVRTLSRMSTQNEVAEEEEYAMDSYRRSSATPPSSSSRHSHGHRPLKVLKALNDFMTAPLWAALASLVVACIPPLQRMLDHRLPPVKGAIALLGDASIPTTLLILGAYFYTSPDTQRQPQSEDRYRSVLPPEHTDLLQRNPSRTPLLKKVQAIFSKLLKRRMRNPPSAEVHSGETKTVVVVVLSRMIIAPLLLMPLIKIATAFRLQKVLDDPVFVVSTVLLVASPPALTLAQITQSTSGESEAYERLLSKTMFWTYCVLTPLSMIVFAIIGLFISKQ